MSCYSIHTESNVFLLFVSLIGIKNYKNGKYRNAFQLFKLGSAGGSMQAQFNLAICYQQGKGTKQNIKQVSTDVLNFPRYFRTYRYG